MNNDKIYIDHKCKLAFELYAYLMPIDDEPASHNCIRVLYNAAHTMNNENHGTVCLYKLYLNGEWTATYTDFAKELINAK